MVKKTKKAAISRGISEDSKYYKEFLRFSNHFRKRIKELRLEKGITQEKMEDFEMKLRNFQRIESGETKNVTLSNIFKLAKALGVSVAELFER